MKMDRPSALIGNEYNQKFGYRILKNNISGEFKIERKSLHGGWFDVSYDSYYPSGSEVILFSTQAAAQAAIDTRIKKDNQKPVKTWEIVE